MFESKDAYGEIIHIIYHYDASFYHVIKISVNFGT